MLEYRYDTQLLIDGEDLDEDAINDYIRTNIPGDCLLAVGDVSIEGYHDNCYNKQWEMTGQMHALNYLKWARGGEFIPTPWEK